VTVSATYVCAICGNVAATVTLVGPGQPDPRLTPEPPGVPPGVGTIFSSVFPESGQISIKGGPNSVSLGPVPMEEVAIALASGSAAALFAVGTEYAPFWCPKCGLSYCRAHYRSYPLFDEGFFDCVEGICPKGHKRTLMD
jgi:predicted RNA-binding Zn-ribbon protein involved in translation (DUF1610 family)